PAEDRHLRQLRPSGAQFVDLFHRCSPVRAVRQRFVTPCLGPLDAAAKDLEAVHAANPALTTAAPASPATRRAPPYVGFGAGAKAAMAEASPAGSLGDDPSSSQGQVPGFRSASDVSRGSLRAV